MRRLPGYRQSTVKQLRSLLLALALWLLLSPAIPATASAPAESLLARVRAAVDQTAAFVGVAYAFLCGVEPEVGSGAPSMGSSPLAAGALAGWQPPPPTLLARYRIGGPLPDYELVRYRPRQFAAGLNLGVGAASLPVDSAGPYAGWDVLNTPERGPNGTMADDAWLSLDLSRPALLAIVWRDPAPPPRWLAAWEQGADVMIAGARLPTFRQSFPAGAVSLGAVYDAGGPVQAPASGGQGPGTNGQGQVAGGPSPSVVGPTHDEALQTSTDGQPQAARQSYLVLFAEADGRPSAAPAVPAGLEAPQANAPCPRWVHDQYRAQGPDGRYYHTWHPPIDPVYGCAFQHEHGADPGPHQALFGYSASQGGVIESHQGFKVYTFDLPGGERVVITHHIGANEAPRAACARYHTFDIAVYRQGALLADLHTLADHGPALHAADGAPLTPPDCPDQAATIQAEGGAGERRFPVSSLDPLGVARWRMDMARTLFGSLSGWSVTVPGRAVDCNTLDCDKGSPTGDQGEFREVRFPAGFGVVAGAQTGAFYTDALGRAQVAESAPGAVRQYLAPGLDLRLPALPAGHACFSDHPFGGAYRCGPAAPISPDGNLEGALR